MSANSKMPQDLLALFDDYVAGALDVSGLEALEARLRSDEAARAHFVRYCKMHTDLCLEMRAQRAGYRALDAIDQGGRNQSFPESKDGPRVLRLWRFVFAATVLLALGLWWWLGREPAGQAAQPQEIAWLFNAQDCRWADNQAPAGDMRPGKVLRLKQGLAEIRFQVGAHVVMEGPADLELLSGNSARLLHGKLTATVPPAAQGFQVISPHGRVVDLGTEFAMSVGSNGWTDVYVYTGKVQAYAGAAQPTPAAAFNVKEKQAARIDAGGVALKPSAPDLDGKQFVRAIVPQPRVVPRTFALDFRRPLPGTITDANGLGIGLTHRLPRTGMELLKNDENLRLDPEKGQLALTTTNTDINTTYQLEVGEYLGVRLADHGFTGKEDFEVTVVVPDIPELEKVGQFGLYAGVHSRKNIRGGMISSSKEPGKYKYILVQNQSGKDVQPHYVGLGFPGNDIRLTLRRKDNEYSLTAEDLKTAVSTILAMPEPSFLTGQKNLYVGFFGANTQSEARRTLMLKEFKVTVWTVAAESQ